MAQEHDAARSAAVQRQQQRVGSYGGPMTPAVLDGSRLAGLRPVRAVTQEEVTSFWRDGVVRLKGVLPPPATSFLRDNIEDIFRRGEGERGSAVWDLTKQADMLEAAGEASRLLADGGYHAGAKRTGRFMTEAGVASWNTDFRLFVTKSPLPEVVAQLLRTTRLKFHNDHLFYKQSGSLMRTAFHQDASYFSMKGEQVAICWVPVDVVTKASGAMGYARGSHRWPDAAGRPGVVFQPKNLVTEQRAQPLAGRMPAGMPELPDIERDEAKYDVVYFDAEPGDVIVHHVNTVHGSAGNTSAARHRRAASIRYIGDDVVYAHAAAGSMVAVAAFLTPSKRGGTSAPWAGGDAEAADVAYRQIMRPGDPLEGPSYPVVWPRQAPSRL